MKRIIAITLALFLLLCMSACGTTKEKTIQERLDAGEEVFIGFAIETVSNPFFLAQAEFLKTEFGKMGVTFEYQASDGDDALMISQIENFITMKADLIMCAPPNQDAVESVLEKAEDAGIPVIIMGQRPKYGDKLSGGTYNTWFEVGREVAMMASAWIDQRYPDAGPGDIHAANLTYNVVGIFVEQNAGMLAQVAEDPRISITYTQEDLDNINGGFDAAETALTRDSSIRLFLCYQESPAIGASNYILSRPDLDADEFACFAAGIQDMGIDQLELSKTNQSLYRGVIAYGTYGAEGVDIPSAAGLFYVTKDVLLGDAPVMPYWSEDDRWALTSFGYEYLFDNPLNDFLIDLYK